MSLPFVSFIIPAHNEADYLRACLESLAKIDYPNFEIIVIDNGSTDNTKEICGLFPSVLYAYYNKKKSSYAARNFGVKLAKGEMLAFFDADQTTYPNYLRELLEPYVPGDPNHVFSGRLTDDERVPLVLKVFFPWDDGSAHPGWRVATASVALPKELFESLGGFNEGILSGGDHEFFRRASKVATIHQCAKVIGTHYWAKNIKEFLRREERYKFGICLRAEACGEDIPSLPKLIIGSFAMAAKKLAAGILVPFRYPRNEWRLRWHGQYLHWLSTVYHIKGVVKFRSGKKTAGDLPAPNVAVAEKA